MVSVTKLRVLRHSLLLLARERFYHASEQHDANRCARRCVFRFGKSQHDVFGLHEGHGQLSRDAEGGMLPAFLLQHARNDKAFLEPRQVNRVERLCFGAARMLVGSERNGVSVSCAYAQQGCQKAQSQSVPHSPPCPTCPAGEPLILNPTSILKPRNHLYFYVIFVIDEITGWPTPARKPHGPRLSPTWQAYPC